MPLWWPWIQSQCIALSLNLYLQHPPTDSDISTAKHSGTMQVWSTGGQLPGRDTVGSQLVFQSRYAAWGTHNSLTFAPPSWKGRSIGLFSFLGPSRPQPLENSRRTECLRSWASLIKMQPWQETRSRPLQERASKLPWTGTDPEREEHLLNPLKLGQSFGWGRSLAGKDFSYWQAFPFLWHPFSPGIPFS